MLRRAFLVASAFALVGSAGCGHFVDGSGVSATETRDVGEVTEVALTGGGTLIIVPGDTNRVIVTADDNVLPLVVTKTEGNKLTLTTKNGYAISEKVPITYTLFVKKLEKLSVTGSGTASGEGLMGESLELSVTGSGDVTMKGLDQNAVSVRVTGSGNVALSGNANKLTAKVTGSGKVEANELKAGTADVTVSGSGDLNVWATDDLKVRVSGSGDVRYKGRPKIDEKVSGSGSVKPMME
jgi:hypothetical protein